MNKVVMQVGSVLELLAFREERRSVFFMPAYIGPPSVEDPYSRPGILFHLVVDFNTAIDFAVYSSFIQKEDIPKGLKLSIIERYYAELVEEAEKGVRLRRVHFHNLILPKYSDADVWSGDDIRKFLVVNKEEQP